MKPRLLRRIERDLKRDIKWAVESGSGWDPRHGAMFDGKRWEPYGDECRSGTCAIGAWCVRRQPDADVSQCDVLAFSEHYGVDSNWTNDLYFEVACLSYRPVRREIRELAVRLRAYASQCEDNKLDRETADQRWAEAMGWA